MLHALKEPANSLLHRLKTLWIHSLRKDLACCRSRSGQHSRIQEIARFGHRVLEQFRWHPKTCQHNNECKSFRGGQQRGKETSQRDPHTCEVACGFSLAFDLSGLSCTRCRRCPCWHLFFHPRLPLIFPLPLCPWDGRCRPPKENLHRSYL